MIWIIVLSAWLIIGLIGLIISFLGDKKESVERELNPAAYAVIFILLGPIILIVSIIQTLFHSGKEKDEQ